MLKALQVAGWFFPVFWLWFLIWTSTNQPPTNVGDWLGAILSAVLIGIVLSLVVFCLAMGFLTLTGP